MMNGYSLAKVQYIIIVPCQYFCSSAGKPLLCFLVNTNIMIYQFPLFKNIIYYYYYNLRATMIEAYVSTDLSDEPFLFCKAFIFHILGIHK